MTMSGSFTATCYKNNAECDWKRIQTSKNASVSLSILSLARIKDLLQVAYSSESQYDFPMLLLALPPIRITQKDNCKGKLFSTTILGPQCPKKDCSD